MPASAELARFAPQPPFGSSVWPVVCGEGVVISLRTVQRIDYLAGMLIELPGPGRAPREPTGPSLMDRLVQLVQAAPCATAVPLIALGVAAAVLIRLGPTIVWPNREPFNCVLELFELVHGRAALVGGRW